VRIPPEEPVVRHPHRMSHVIFPSGTMASSTDAACIKVLVQAALAAWDAQG